MVYSATGETHTTIMGRSPAIILETNAANTARGGRALRHGCGNAVVAQRTALVGAREACPYGLTPSPHARGGGLCAHRRPVAGTAAPGFLDSCALWAHSLGMPVRQAAAVEGAPARVIPSERQERSD